MSESKKSPTAVDTAADLSKEHVHDSIRGNRFLDKIVDLFVFGSEVSHPSTHKPDHTSHTHLGAHRSSSFPAADLRHLPTSSIDLEQNSTSDPFDLGNRPNLRTDSPILRDYPALDLILLPLLLLLHFQVDRLKLRHLPLSVPRTRRIILNP